MMTAILLIEDEKVILARSMKKLKAEMDSLKQTYLRLDVTYKEKRARYEEIDKSRALSDGRLRIVKTITKKETKQEPMTQDQINVLLSELENLLK